MNKDYMINVRLDSELKDKFLFVKRKIGMNKSNLIRLMIEDYCDRFLEFQDLYNKSVDIDPDKD